MTKLSFVIPCYRSEQTIEGVVNEIQETMQTLPEYSYEIILVNDCSPDQTFDVIRGLCEKNSNILGVNLARNFGQHAAIMAGLHYATGDLVAFLDDDGQTPANEIGKLLMAIEAGADVAMASYDQKKHSAFRNWGSRVNEYMLRVMLKKPRNLSMTSFFVVRWFVAENMMLYTNSYPYLPGLLLRCTKNIVNVPVHHREREIGASGYTFKKLLGLWINGFTAFSVVPLRVATLIGTCSAVLGFLYGIYTVIRKLVDPNILLGFSSLMSAILFIGGMLMIILGLIGEYIGRIYISLNNSPQYVVREKVGKGQEESDKDSREK